MNKKAFKVRFFQCCRHYFLLFAGMVLVLSLLAGCGGRPSKDDLNAVDYGPLQRDDWEVSTPAEQGLDPMLVAEFYYHASQLDTIHSLLVIKNGYLVAEKYFNGGAVDQKDRLQSVTKSFTSALVGLALEQGYISGVDQKMMEFFPELAGSITDPRKNRITIREMLQMRAGYPWEESTAELFEMLYGGFRPSFLAEVPLVRDPGTKFEYSNLTSHLLGIIVARASGTDLRSFAEENLFAPLDVEAGEWIQDWEGYYNGHADLHMTARDMARFGLLYLNDGKFRGEQIVPAGWVRDSLQSYSEGINATGGFPKNYGLTFGDIGYGYQWWSAESGKHRYDFAWGHGGQQIALPEEYNMVIVVTADPLFGQHGGESWKHESANLNLVADFIKSLPGK